MRLGTHIRAARSAKGLSVAASSLISGLSHRRLAAIEEGDRLPTGDELATLTITNGLDSQTVFLWACNELMERLFIIGRDGAPIPDEDLFFLWDSMVAFLAQRGRI
jgi:transcriptional regulator with XRE-family HTH domain